jgi:hypothetical protein
MEVGLRSLGAHVGVRKRSPTWDAVLKAIDGKLNPKPGVKKSRRWRKQEQFVAEAASHLRAVKTAWRNPVMHRIDNVYGGPKTEDVFRHVRAFMVHLASELKEAPA